MEFSNILFRASGVGHLMTEPKNKEDKASGGLSEGAKTHLVDIYVSEKYGRRTEIESKYINKGNMVEEDSITLYSRLKKRFFKKNEEHLSNAFLQGTPDLFEGPSIRQAHTITDTKSSWDIFTFFRVKAKPLNQLYYWQGQAYMALTGANNFNLAYCLIDTPETLIMDEERKLMWKMNAGTTENPAFITACEELRKQMTYPDIPMKERLIEYSFERNDQDILRMYDKIRKGRAFLREFDRDHCPEDASKVIAAKEPVKSLINPSAILLTKIKN